MTSNKRFYRTDKDECFNTNIEKNVTDRDIYRLLIKIDEGYSATSAEREMLASIISVSWNNISK